MAGKPNYTDEQLEHLTDEEREGLLDEDLLDDEPDEDEEGGPAPEADKAAAPADKDAPKPEDENAKDDTAEPGKVEDDAGTEADTGEPDGDAGGDAAAPAQPPRPAAALPRWEPPENAKAQLEQIEKDKDALSEKFDNGELTGTEFRQQLAALDKQEREIDWKLRKAELARESRAEAFTQAAGAFVGQHTQYKPGTPGYRALDAEVRALQTQAMQDGGDPLDPGLIAQAHANIEAAFGRTPAPKPAASKTDGAAAGKRPAPPPTLGDLPAADATEATDGGEFAFIDRLTGTAYEEAMAKLTPDQRDRYLQQM